MPGHCGPEYSRRRLPDPLDGRNVRSGRAVPPAPRAPIVGPSCSREVSSADDDEAVDPAHLRSIVLAGHAGGGNTALAEQPVFRAGAIPRLGKVDDGTAHLDFEPEEQKRRESLSLAVATFEHDATRITLVDTPGYPDFVADVIYGFAAADGALFVMDASSGVESGLESSVRLGRSTTGRRASSSTSATARTRTRLPRSTPCATFRQQDRADPPGHRHARLVPRPRRPGPPQGVRPGNGKRSRNPDPGRAGRRGAARRDQLLEAAAEADDDVMTKYLDGAEISTRSSTPACATASTIGSSPRCWWAPRRKGSDNALLDAIVRYLPTPRRRATGRRPRRAERPPVAIPPDPDGHVVARVFKTTADPFVGRLTYLRVLTGPSTVRPMSGTPPATRTSGSASSCSCTARTRNRSASCRPVRSAPSRS